MVNNVPGIPDWTHKYGDNTIHFEKADKVCYVNKTKFNKDNVPCGDYAIQVSIPSYNNWQQITDKEFITILKRENSDLEALKLKATNNFNSFKKETDLVTSINKEKFTDIEKLFLNYAWHRCIIEERAYARPYYGGKDTFLNIIK